MMKPYDSRFSALLKKDKTLLLMTCIGLLFWTLFSVFKQFQTFIVYFWIWIGCFGWAIYWNRHKIQRYFSQLPLPGYLKISLSIYAIVLTEEIFAGFANHLSETFSLKMLFVRILQFQFFNLFAFSGLAIGWAILHYLFRYSKREIFYYTAFWGIFSEGIYKILFSNTLAFILMAPMILMTYGIIVTPALLSIQTTGKYHLHFVLKTILTYFLIFALSVPFSIVIQWIFHCAPHLFPPPHFLGH